MTVRPVSKSDEEAFLGREIESDEESGSQLLGSSLAATAAAAAMDSVSAVNVRFFTKLYVLTQLLGVLSVVLIGVWIAQFHKGFAWQSNPAVEFNWHPLLMVLGLVFLYANGALMFRGFRTERKMKLKLLHAGFQAAALIVSSVGLKAVFDSHNLKDPPAPNMYSLHSWIGLSAVILFCCQWVMGLVTFLIPGLRSSLRAAYLPVHRFFGLAIFVTALAAALTGLTEKALWSLSSSYSSFVPEGILINVIGLTLIIFGGFVVYLAANPQFQRRTSEEEILLTDTVME
ncbi:transmembrane ascorbate-dependent reductase CYB561 isoform X2 [Oratosquilla oratoria]|uniref:transmembrane ascorbate-dependent reductase CYB561 isoform X2 n=1 Tax=Oratosquilla oratoria TaxID=337810 RepID=UPI003F76D319